MLNMPETRALIILFHIGLRLSEPRQGIQFDGCLAATVCQSLVPKVNEAEYE